MAKEKTGRTVPLGGGGHGGSTYLAEDANPKKKKGNPRRLGHLRNNRRKKTKTNGGGEKRRRFFRRKSRGRRGTGDRQTKTRRDQVLKGKTGSAMNPVKCARRLRQGKKSRRHQKGSEQNQCSEYKQRRTIGGPREDQGRTVIKKGEREEKGAEGLSRTQRKITPGAAKQGRGGVPRGGGSREDGSAHQRKRGKIARAKLRKTLGHQHLVAKKFPEKSQRAHNRLVDGSIEN